MPYYQDGVSKMNLEFSKRFVQSKHWRWIPGIRLVGKYSGHPIRIIDFGERAFDVYDVENPENLLWWREPNLSGPGGSYDGPYLPDLNDPATIGCILELVREVWKNKRLVAIYCEAANPGQSEGWAIQTADNRIPIAGEDYSTEVEALLAALEAAP